MSKPLFTERLSFGITPEMDRFLEDLARSRTRQGKPTSKADLLREAVRLYLDQQADLTGSRKQIARSMEGKLEALTTSVQALTGQVQAMQRLLRQHSDDLTTFGLGLQPLIRYIEARQGKK